MENKENYIRKDIVKSVEKAIIEINKRLITLLHSYILPPQ